MGADGGIDIRGFTENEIVIQVKHYSRSNKNLIHSLEKEIPKISSLNIKRYFIVTSRELNPDSEDKIYNMFKNYGLSKENIFDGVRLNEFLSDPKNEDIVRMHYKLWLTSTNVLNTIFNNNISIDTSVYISQFEKNANIFVETTAYNDAIRILQEKNILLLEGAPGVGKTMNSQMLARYFCEEGYRPLYASNNSLRDIKKSLYDDSLEIIILNDFLGQHYLKCKHELIEELKTLVIYISRSRSKKLILNSRITILNEAIRINPELELFLDDMKITRYNIDIDKVSYLEKARIYYLHLLNHNVPEHHIEQLQKDKRYMEIIKHRNFNPRIIEYVTRKTSWERIDSKNYLQFTMEKLDNPKDIWKSEIDCLSAYDRIFMNTLYSLSNTHVDYNILKECFDLRINKKHDYDTTINEFDACLYRLSESLINLVDYGDMHYIAILNPSISDYIYNELRKNSNEVLTILEHHIYFEQLVTLLDFNQTMIKEFIVNKIQSDEFLQIKTYSLPISYQYLYYISEFEIYNTSLRESIIAKLFDSKTYNNDFNIDSYLMEKFFCNNEIYTFYKLGQLLYNIQNLNYIYDKADIRFIKKFIPIHEQFIELNKNILYTEDELEGFRFMIKWALELDIIKQLNGSMTSLISNALLKNIPEMNEVDLHQDEFEYYREIKSRTLKELEQTISILSEEFTANYESKFIIKNNMKVYTKIIIDESSFNEIFDEQYENRNFIISLGKKDLYMTREENHDEFQLIATIFDHF